MRLTHMVWCVLASEKCVENIEDNYSSRYPSYSYKANTIELLSNYEYNTTTGYHIRRQKVRKKVLENSQEKTDKAMELTPSNHFDNEETYYVGYAKNPFGPSFRWDKNKSFSSSNLQKGKRWSEDNNEIEVKEVRGKRGVTHLYNMIACATGCDPISYKGYGCYCGFLGSGEYTDYIDRCCMVHDICYSAVNCPIFLVYFTPYIWRCWAGRPQCSVGHGSVGYGGVGSCATRLCECDRELALCLARRPCPNKRALCTSSPWRLLQNIILY